MYDDEREAILAKQLIEAAGGYVAEANRIADAINKPGLTVAQVVAEHIDLLTAVGSDTRAHYRQQMKAHTVPTLGVFPVAALTYRQVADWVADMSRKGWRPRRSPRSTGSSPLRWRRPCGSVTALTTPAPASCCPSRSPPGDDMTVLTRDEFMLLLSKVSAHYQPLVLTLVATGLRWGEATALAAGDVDLVSQPATIRVTKAWKRDQDRHWYVGPPKTKRARRTVSLPDDLVDVLFPLVAGKAPDALLFTNTVGAQLQSSRFWTTTWTPALEAARNPRRPDGSPDPDSRRLTKRPRVHDLRHTHASWMIAAGTDLFVLQRRLGHESITTTTETYAHLLPDQQRAAADAASRAMAGLSIHPSGERSR